MVRRSIALILIGLAACGPPESASPGTTVPTEVALAGSRWPIAADIDNHGS